MTPELCTTSLIYDAIHDLMAWIDPLGFRTTYVYDPASASSVQAVVQPLGQRTTYSSYISTIGLVTKDTIRPRNGANLYWTVVVYPTMGRTTLTLGENTPSPPSAILNPVGNRTSYAYTYSGGGSTNTLGYLSRVDGRPRPHDHDLVSVRRRGHDGHLPDRASRRRSPSTSTGTTATTSSRP